MSEAPEMKSLQHPSNTHIRLPPIQLQPIQTTKPYLPTLISATSLNSANPNPRTASLQNPGPDQRNLHPHSFRGNPYTLTRPLSLNPPPFSNHHLHKPHIHPHLPFTLTSPRLIPVPERSHTSIIDDNISLNLPLFRISNLIQSSPVQ